MRTLAGWLIGFFGSPAGIFVLAALDSTIFFSLPGGIDAAIIFVAARRQILLSIVVIALAVAGSIAGAALTFWTGRRIGHHQLDRYVATKRLERIKRRIQNAGAVGLAILDLIPPPFPFTAFILAAGALEIDATTFFGVLAGCRILRFGGEATLATVYGRQLLRWTDSDVFRGLAIAACVLAAALTALSVTRLVASSRRRRETA